MEISIVIPAFDEESRIAGAVAAVIAQMETLDVAFEVLCVDDGSADQTLPVVEAMARRDPRVRALKLAGHRGKGAAVREGVLAARGDLIFFLDADLSTPPAAIGDALPHLRNGADIVRGSRHCAGARVVRPQGRVRRSLGRVFLRLARRVADPGATDLTCGFKGFSRDAARAVFQRTRLPGWAFDAEVALVARRLGYVTREIPVEWTNDPDTRVRVPGAVLSGLVDLARLARDDLCGRYRR